MSGETIIRESDLLLKHPFSLIISGGTHSGKSEWLTRLIKNRDKMINTKFDRVTYHYGVLTPTVLKLQQLGIETYPHLPDPNDYFKSENKSTLLCMDDFLSEASEQFLQDLFTRGTHHHNISTVFVTQHLYAKSLKVPRLNCSYFCFLRNPANEREIRTFAHQTFPRQFKFFTDSYTDAVKPLYGYLFVDLHPQSPPLLRLRTRIFEDSIIYSN